MPYKLLKKRMWFHPQQQLKGKICHIHTELSKRLLKSKFTISEWVARFRPLNKHTQDKPSASLSFEMTAIILFGLSYDESNTVVNPLIYTFAIYLLFEIINQLWHVPSVLKSFWALSCHHLWNATPRSTLSFSTAPNMERFQQKMRLFRSGRI